MVGLTPVAEQWIISGRRDHAKSLRRVDRLLAYDLSQRTDMGIAGPLEKLQKIATLAREKVGSDRNAVLLRLGLQATQGYSVKTRMFSIGSAGEIGVDLAASKICRVSLSAVMRDLEDWQIKYIEYLSHELDRETLRQIVYTVHGARH